MEPLNPPSELTLTQVKGILSAFGSYSENKSMQNGFASMSISGRSVSPLSNETSSLLGKVKNYMSQFIGWKQDLSSLPDLVRKIDLFISFGPESEVNLIEEKELQAAALGLSVVMSNKSLKSTDDPNIRFIEQSLVILMHINNKLKQQRKRQAALFAERVSLPDRNIVQLSATTSSMNRLNPFSYFSHSTSPKILPSKKESMAEIPEVSVKGKSPFKETSHSLSSREIQMIKSLYPAEINENKELQQEIRTNLVNPSLTTLRQYKSVEGEIINIPQAFIEDLNRIVLLFNGGLLYDHKKDEGIKDPVNICIFLRNQLGQRCFEKVAVLLNQGIVATVWGYLDDQKKPKEWQNENSPYKGFYFVNWPPTICNVADKNDTIQINTKIIFVLRDNCMAEGAKGLPRGFIAFERQIIVPKTEMQVDIAGIQTNKIIPSLQVRELFSEFSLNPMQAEQQLQTITKRSVFIEIWNFVFGKN